MKRKIEEHEVAVGKRIQIGPNEDAKIISDKEVIIYMGNGGHLRLISETPIQAFCKPEGD